MQKLVWKNSKDIEIDLTSGYFGITKWEGFSNTGLNLQTQKVPFQDGSVFLDGLLNDRELTVTLAINDGNDLEKRYELRRQLIAALNPKLNEGYLIYTNDFISKRIKCIAKLPVFTNKNSNDKGTYKASLSWTACEPYWEDLEETNIDIELGEFLTVENKGDVPAQPKIEFLTGGVINPIIKNLTTDKLIGYNGTLNKNLVINTENGNKNVLGEDLEFVVNTNSIDLHSVIFNHKTNKFIFVGASGLILTSGDLKNWSQINSGVSIFLYQIIYSYEKDLFIIVAGSGTILTSSDGINWTQRVSNTSATLYSICYSNSLDLFVAVGSSGTILTSPDGITWTSQTSGAQSTDIFMSIIYSEEKELFVTVGTKGIIYTSADGINWTQREDYILPTNYLRSVCYSEKLDLFVAVSSWSVIVTSSDGITWTQQGSPSASYMYKSICWSEEKEVFVLIGESTNNYPLIYVSSDGINWTLVADYSDLGEVIISTVTYLENEKMFFIVGSGGYILSSVDGINWKVENEKSSNENKSIYYSEEKQIYIIAGRGILISSDGINWTKVRGFDDYSLRSVNYFPEVELFMITGYKTILTSPDGINWAEINSEAIQNSGSLNGSCYSEKLNLFVVVGNDGIILTSPDGINWTSQTSGINNYIFTVCWSEEKEIFVAAGRAYSLISSDGINWTSNSIGSQFYIINSIIYVSKFGLFMGAGYDGGQSAQALILTSPDGINWTLKKFLEIPSVNFNSIFYCKNKEEIIMVGSYGTILTSFDAKNWSMLNVYPNVILESITYNEKTNIFTLISQRLIFNSEIKYENKIQNLSSDSNMGLNLEVGDNVLTLTEVSGNFHAKLTYRQKYVGV